MPSRKVPSLHVGGLGDGSVDSDVDEVETSSISEALMEGVVDVVGFSEELELVIYLVAS